MDVTLNAQTAVLGSMLIDDQTIPILMAQLCAEDFPDSTYRHIFEAIHGLFLQNATIDAVTVLAALGDAYSLVLARIMQLTPTAANCEEYARLLREDRQLRDIQQACGRIALSDHIDLPQARQLLADAAMLLVDPVGSKIKRYSYLDLVNRCLDRLTSEEPRDFLDFGLTVLNQRVHVAQGTFVIIGAYSSVGKTAFALQLGLNIAKSGKRVGFYSYETREENVGDRMVAYDADVNLQKIKERKTVPGDIYRIMAVGERAGVYPFTMIESARMDTAHLRADILAHRYDVVFVDYIQLIPGRGGERKDVVAQVSMDLHAMCQELAVTIIALSQVTLPELNKDKSRRWICMQDLRESKQLLQDGETILLLDLEHPQNRASDRVLIIDKNKDGPTGNFFLTFDASRMRFRYRDPEQKEKKKKKNDDNEDAQIDGQLSVPLEDLPGGKRGLPF